MEREIDNRYVLDAIIGKGAMGVVWAARHKFTGSRVAVKLARRELGLDAELESRFLVEARGPSAIDHPGVIKVFDAGKTSEGELYLVMELLTGRSLREQMEAGVDAPMIRRIGLELLDALAATHAGNIIHRDLKPENVFLVAPTGAVKILDFGLTKMLTNASERSLTVAGLVLGTITYMAPEQLVDAASVDGRTDLWAVSVILYEMLAGRLPHRAATLEAMYGALVHKGADPISVAWPEVPAPIDAFFRRALARDPDARFATAIDMATAFAELPLGPATILPPASDSHPQLPAKTPVVGRDPGLGSAPTAAAGSSGVRRRVDRAIDPAIDAAYRMLSSSTPGSWVKVVTSSAHPGSGSVPALASFAHAAPPADRMPSYGAQLIKAGRRRRWMLAVAGLALTIVASIFVGLALIPHRAQHAEVATPAAVAPGPPAIAPPDPATGPPASPSPSRRIAVAPPDPTTAPGPSQGIAVAPGPPSRQPRAPATIVEPPSPAEASAPTRRHRHGRPVEIAPVAPPAPARTPAPAPAPIPAAAPPSACAVGCKLLDTCHLGTPSCEADCGASKIIEGCLRQANNDCNRFAACWFAWSCGGKTTSGAHSCGAAIACEATCTGNAGCLCTCIRGAAPTAAASLLAYNGCMLGCRGDASCIATRCDAQAQRCRAGE